MKPDFLLIDWYGYRGQVTPQIMNTDQGKQSTSSAFIRVLEQNGVQISMEGRGYWRDNVFVERLWKSLKYEEVYLHGYDTVSIARQDWPSTSTPTTAAVRIQPLTE